MRSTDKWTPSKISPHFSLNFTFAIKQDHNPTKKRQKVNSFFIIYPEISWISRPKMFSTCLYCVSFPHHHPFKYIFLILVYCYYFSVTTSLIILQDIPNFLGENLLFIFFFWEKFCIFPAKVFPGKSIKN